MSLPPYIERSGDLVLQQPITAEGVQFYGFWLEANPARLQGLCDRYLNGPSAGAVRFRPLGPYVLLCFCRLAAMRCTNPPDSGKGWFSEDEVAFWVPVVDEAQDRVCWFLPYILVDNAYALAMGREIYGFPKGYGWFEIPEKPTDPLHFAADTTVLPVYAPETHATRMRLVEATAEASDALLGEAWRSFEHGGHLLLDALRGHHNTPKPLDELKLMLHIGEDLLRGIVRFVFLKQFRDVANPGLACYQAVVESVAKMTRFKGGHLLPSPFNVSVRDYASHPVRQNLGLPAEPIRPIVSFWVNFDMVVEHGAPVWQPGSSVAGG